MSGDPALLDDNDSTRSITLQELQRRAIRAELAEGMHTRIPCRVNRYDASIQQVDVLPLVRDFHRDETGALVVASMPIVTNVPVHFPSGGGYRSTLPIHVGDLGWLAFAERSIDRWLSGDGGEVDPEIYTRFNLTDGVFQPGGLPFGAPLKDCPTDRAAWGKDGGLQIQITDGGRILLGGPAVTQAALLGTMYRAAQKNLQSIILGDPATGLFALLGQALTAAGNSPVMSFTDTVASAALITAGTQATAIAAALFAWETAAALQNDYLSYDVFVDQGVP